MAIDATCVYHVNVNCTDLDRSLAFYRDLVGLDTVSRTAPTAPQPGAAFGLDQVQWDAWIMQGADGFDGVVLDLLEWKVPPPAGEPPAGISQLGFNRLIISSPDLDDLHHRLREAGADVWSEPTAIVPDTEDRQFICSDPDGTAIQFVSGTGTGLASVNVNCSDLEASRRFYTDVMGMTVQSSALDVGPVPGRSHRAADPMRWSAHQLGDIRGFIVDLVEWTAPASIGSGRRKANELGMFRMAWFTPDIEAAYQELIAAGVHCYSPPVALQMGPGLPDDLLALFFEDPDGTCLELIQPPRH